jgi:hypothetical protein
MCAPIKTGGVSPRRVLRHNPCAAGDGGSPLWLVTSGGHVEACPRLFSCQRLDLRCEPLGSHVLEMSAVASIHSGSGEDELMTSGSGEAETFPIRVG